MGVFDGYPLTNEEAKIKRCKITPSLSPMAYTHFIGLRIAQAVQHVCDAKLLVKAKERANKTHRAVSGA